MDKKEYKKPELVEEEVEIEDIMATSSGTNSKQSVFKPDAGIWDIFRW